MSKQFIELGKRIKQCRKAHGYTQAEFAELLDISVSHVSDIENGKKMVGLDIFMRITEVLQVSADWLLQTDTPSVAAIQNQELDQLLKSCSSSQVSGILKIIKEIKDMLKE